MYNMHPNMGTEFSSRDCIENLNFGKQKFRQLNKSMGFMDQKKNLIDIESRVRDLALTVLQVDDQRSFDEIRKNLVEFDGQMNFKNSHMANLANDLVGELMGKQKQIVEATQTKNTIKLAKV